MYRIVMLVVCGVSLAVLSVGCKTNRPPTPPQLIGPTLGKPGATLTYTFSSSDPENQEITYMVAWGDTSKVEWSSAYASGTQVTRTHEYPDSGVYHVKVKARDTLQAESEWSDSIIVSIGFRPPNQPGRPSGPVSCTTYIAYTAKTTHPLGDSVWFQFNWGGGAGNWDGPVASDSQFQKQHAFDSVGTFGVSVRAKDARGDTSAWSDPLDVATVQNLNGPPLELRLSAATDSTIALSWLAPTQGTPAGYNVYFKDVAGTSFKLVDTVSSMTATHDPHGATGQYAVSAAYGGLERFCAETLSTVPVHTAEVALFEVNANPSRCGFGWNRDSGTGGVFSMTDSANCRYVDFYVSDLQRGVGGLMNIVSPDGANSIDTGAAGTVPAAAWRTNGFSNPLSNPQNPLPGYQPPPNANYFAYTGTSQLPCYIACYTAGDTVKHYALIQVDSFRVASGRVWTQSWYQLVPSLRLMHH